MTGQALRKTAYELQQMLIDHGADVEIVVVDPANLEAWVKRIDLIVTNEDEFIKEKQLDKNPATKANRSAVRQAVLRALSDIIAEKFKLDGGGNNYVGYQDKDGGYVCMSVDYDDKPLVGIEEQWPQEDFEEELTMTTTSFKQFFTEARKPGVNFKEEKTKGVVVKVIAQLEAHDAAQLTRIARQFHSIEKAMKRLAEKRAELGNQLRDVVGVTFDAELDKFYTRVLASASFTATVAKETKPEDVADKVEIEYERLVDGLKAMLDETLIPAADKLVAECTKTWKPEVKTPSLSVKKIDEAVGATMANWWRKVKETLAGFFSKFDKELPKLEKQLAKYKALPKPKVIKENDEQNPRWVNVDWHDIDNVEDLIDFCQDNLDDETYEKLDDELRGLHIEDPEDHEEAEGIIRDFLDKHYTK